MAKVRKIRKDTESSEEKQSQMFDESVLDGLRTENMFEVELSLSIKKEEAKADKLILLSTKARGTLIEQLLIEALNQRRNRAVIQAVLDNPSADELAEAERLRAIAQRDAGEALEA